MKKIDLKCQNCGALMHVSEDKTEAVCPYCKNKFLLSKEENIVDLAKKEEQLSYARKSGERKAIEDSERRKKRAKFFSKLKVFMIIFIVISVSFFVSYFSLDYIADPFDCVSVEFVGVDGKGIVRANDTKTCEYYGDISYKFSKEKDLNEGEKIKITASSENYRFGVYSKEFIVKGLSRYLTDLNDLTDEMLLKLHDYSYNHLSSGAFCSTFYGEIVTLEPYKLFLLTNNDNENTLFDVYKTSIKTPTGNVYDKIVVAYYNDFLLLSNSELFSYSKLYHCGGIIDAGDPNALSVLNDNYVGNIVGFENIEDFRAYLSQDNDGSFVIKER